ncbi:protein FAR1-RELATED SEQUENCE 6-like isoform X2 [Typha angustifolia]|uniref:protein FAR1-RELATED SEQUENCE 6-like isoform X2 n=1 Tax=Typha angustifolia TaxID=59011 RepID=UPI003C2B2C7D
MVVDSIREEPLEEDGDVDERDSELYADDTASEDVKTPQMSIDMGDDSAEDLPLPKDKVVTFVEDNVHENDQDKDDPVVGHVKVEGDDKTPSLGMVFRSYDEVCSFYKKYALTVGFGVAVRKSSFTKSGVCRRLILACTRGGKGRADACYQARQTAKTNCQAMIVVKLWSDGLLHLVEANLEHNHPVSPSAARLMTCYKKMIDAMREEPVAWPIGRKDAQPVEKACGNSSERGRMKFGEGDDESIYQFFATMQNKNPNFFYLVDLDKHGCLRSLFWADARSRAAHAYFGHDVIYIDTAYLTEKYDLPLVSFVGMNHHGQLVLFACGLLSDEALESYTWLFRAFLTCTLQRCPDAVITDNCKTIQAAVSEVFPQAQHRLCLSLIMKRIPEKLKGFAESKAMMKALEKATFDSLRPNEFEEKWKKMIEEYRLEDHEWFCSLYADRHLWAPVFLKDKFWAGLSISQRGESITSFFDGFVYPRTSLKQFLVKYEMVIQSKYKKEAQADSESFHKTPLIISKFYMEEQLSKEYTVNMFRKFQDELKATMYCHATPIKANGPLITFEVKECSYIEDGKRTDSKEHEVYFNEDELAVQCICGFFQFSGILCRHALSVFKLQQVFEIPSQYILSRWKKDYKKLHSLAHSSKEMLSDNIVERHNHLSSRCLELVELGFLSDNRYQVALKLLKEAEKSLLGDVPLRDGQPKLVSFETQSSENVQSLLTSQVGFPEGNKNSESSSAKHRGRTPKKGRDSNMGTNKEQDFLGSSLVGNEPHLLQGAPTVSHLDSHMSPQGGINLMEDIAPNELSFGTHFGMHVNHHHHMPSQPRIPSSNVMQGQYDHQSIGSQSRMQWIYQEMMQEDQISKPPFGRRMG